MRMIKREEQNERMRKEGRANENDERGKSRMRE
jgi:hypothetical protein